MKSTSGVSACSQQRVRNAAVALLVWSADTQRCCCGGCTFAGNKIGAIENLGVTQVPDSMQAPAVFSSCSLSCGCVIMEGWCFLQPTTQRAGHGSGRRSMLYAAAHWSV